MEESWVEGYNVNERAWLIFNVPTCEEDEEIRKIIRREGKSLSGGLYSSQRELPESPGVWVEENIIEFSSDSIPKEILFLATDGYYSSDCVYKIDSDGFQSINSNLHTDARKLGLSEKAKVLEFVSTQYAPTGSWSSDNLHILVADGDYLVQIRVNDYLLKTDGAAREVALAVLKKIYAEKKSLG